MMIQMCPTEVRVHTLCTREVMLGLRVWIIYAMAYGFGFLTVTFTFVGSPSCDGALLIQVLVQSTSTASRLPEYVVLL
jgi:hypothetical protein